MNARLAKYRSAKRFLYKIRIVPKRLDELPWPDNIMIWDVRKGLPFEDGTVKYIYTSHLLEHLKRDEADFLLKECYRVLKKGGIVKVVVPDLESAIKNYIRRMEQIEEESVDYDVAPADELLDGLGLFDNRGQDDSGLVRFVRTVQGNKNLHKWMYDYHSLRLKVRQCGFVEVVKKGYLDSRIEDIDLLDNPERFSRSVCVEATKG